LVNLNECFGEFSWRDFFRGGDTETADVIVGVFEDGPFDVCPAIVEFGEGIWGRNGGGGGGGSRVWVEGRVVEISCEPFIVVFVGVALSLFSTAAFDMTVVLASLGNGLRYSSFEVVTFARDSLLRFPPIC
jgi:hypothetical protein